MLKLDWIGCEPVTSGPSNFVVVVWLIRHHMSRIGPFLLSYWVFVFIFSYFIVSVQCARLKWPSRQLFSTISTIDVSYPSN